eukprot:1144767-Pelagomonas_calceolata.AAC.1
MEPGLSYVVKNYLVADLGPLSQSEQAVSSESCPLSMEPASPSRTLSMLCVWMLAAPCLPIHTNVLRQKVGGDGGAQEGQREGLGLHTLWHACWHDCISGTWSVDRPGVFGKGCQQSLSAVSRCMVLARAANSRMVLARAASSHGLVWPPVLEERPECVGVCCVVRYFHGQWRAALCMRTIEDPSWVRGLGIVLSSVKCQRRFA